MKKVLFVLIFVVISLGLAAQTLVYTPSLNSPVDSATDQMPDVVLNWDAVSGSTNLQYQVQLALTPDFTSPIVDVTQTLLTGYQTSMLTFNTMYYWRVRAIDGATSDWSEVWCFTVFNTVILYRPTNNADDQESNVNLQWRDKLSGIDITGVEFFHYQADTSANFDSPLLIAGTVDGDVFLVPTEWLRFGGHYYWRVQAGHSGSSGDWTEPFEFNVLDAVDLSAPANNATNQVLSILLRWKVVGGILSYNYEIASDENFSNLVFSGETDLLQVNAEFLMFGIDYWWRVRARHQNDTTNWGDPRKFTSINTVLLTTPSSNAVNVLTTPTMIWTAQTGITGFQLQIATDIGFTDLFYDIKPDSDVTSAKVTKKMEPLTDYFWRMRAFSDGGPTADTTDWSEPWKFTTGFAQGIGDQKAAAFRIYPNPANGQAFLKIQVQEAAEAQCKVIDLLGKTVLVQKFSLNIGENRQAINLDNVRQGIYIIRLTIDGRTMNQKLVVE